LAKQLTLLLIILTVFASNAQESFDTNTDLIDLSQTFLFSDFDSTTVSYELRLPTVTPVSFMSVEYVDSAILANHLNASLHFKKNRSGMEKTGRILTFVGVPLAILGGIMVAGADELYYECVNGDCRGDASGGFGIVALAAGVGLSGTGGVLWIIGSKK